MSGSACVVVEMPEPGQVNEPQPCPNGGDCDVLFLGVGQKPRVVCPAFVKYVASGRQDSSGCLCLGRLGCFYDRMNQIIAAESITVAILASMHPSVFNSTLQKVLHWSYGIDETDSIMGRIKDICWEASWEVEGKKEAVDRIKKATAVSDMSKALADVAILGGCFLPADQLISAIETGIRETEKDVDLFSV